MPYLTLSRERKRLGNRKLAGMKRMTRVTRVWKAVVDVIA